MAVNDIRIRALTLRDRDAVTKIARATWGRFDYTQRAFAGWVRDGGLFGAELDGTIVGFAKLTRLSATEAFLEGLRVAPRWRRRGVASALIAYRLEQAKRDGMRIARFVTWSENRAMHHMARRFGFRRVSQDAWVRGTPREGPTLRQADARDIPRLWSLARAAGGLLREQQHASRFRTLAREDLVKAIAERRCLVLDEGAARAFALVWKYRDEPAGRRAPRRDGSLDARYVAAAPGALRPLGLGLRAHAKRRRLSDVYVGLPLRKRPGLLAAGYTYTSEGYGVVYEKRL